MNQSATLTDSNFDQLVLNAPLPVLVDFWATWCPPCRLLSPIVEEIGREEAARMTVLKLDTDANPATAARFDIRSIPTLILFKNGKPVHTMIGYQPKRVLFSKLQPFLS